VTFLPIASRELRVSARNKATYRLRIFFAMGGSAIAGVLLLFNEMTRGSAGMQIGMAIFQILKFVSFLFACAAGVFLTSDCLSEEKRDGTLGLLFLTDLRGHDVVLGKLLATSLRTFYALLAIFPIMALSFVLGGVAVDDFQQSIIAICNALFFSLALGMVISVISRDSNKAMTATLGAMIGLMAIIQSVAALKFAQKFFPHLDWASPATALNAAGKWNRTHDFWMSVWVVQLEAWAFLAVASWLAPRTWQEKGFRARFGRKNPARIRARTSILLEKNPVCWIISRDKWGASISRIAIVPIIALLIISTGTAIYQTPRTLPASSPSLPVVRTTRTQAHSSSTFIYSVGTANRLATNNLYLFVNQCTSFLLYAVDFWLAAQVCRFYVEGRKSGFLELLRVTPIKPLEILDGHWLAIRRLFLLPVVCLTALMLARGTIQALATYSITTASAGASVSTAPPAVSGQVPQIIMETLGALNWVVGLFALAWFSIWMGMRSKGTNVALLKTLALAKVAPWFAVMVISGFVMMGIVQMKSGVGGFLWIWSAIHQGLTLTASLLVIVFARNKARQAILSWPD
jgi:ABC-type transport system involved in cytochrome c biogenesis permease component